MSEIRFFPLWPSIKGQGLQYLAFYQSPASIRKIFRENIHGKAIVDSWEGGMSRRTQLGQLKMSNNLKCPKFIFSV